MKAEDSQGILVRIGGLAIRIWADDDVFLQTLVDRYAGFVSRSLVESQFNLHINLVSGFTSLDEDLRVNAGDGRWCIHRGDFEAECSPQLASGWIRQTANPFSIDSLLRILHTLLLAPKGGFLLHAASAVRHGRAFVFTGVSGAGKTTISRLAPPDVALLTDEISYVVPAADRYTAFGTPFAGELARVGENISAPIDTVFVLAQGSKNSVEQLPQALAVRALLRNILFFAEDPGLVGLVFQAACAFVARVPVRRLTFVPDQKIWELIG